VLEAEIAAATAVGLRFHPCRRSMDLGRSAGGLPPDEIVEDPDGALAATAEAVRRFHEPSPEAMVRVAVAPCSPFSVSFRLMREMAELARGLGVRMHTHLAETRGPRGPGRAAGADGRPVTTEAGSATGTRTRSGRRVTWATARPGAKLRVRDCRCAHLRAAV
jgi:cytosine/adenosine deaminase-related metal-dependent hydrolase